MYFFDLIVLPRMSGSKLFPFRHSYGNTFYTFLNYRKHVAGMWGQQSCPKQKKSVKSLSKPSCESRKSFLLQTSLDPKSVIEGTWRTQKKIPVREPESSYGFFTPVSGAFSDTLRIFKMSLYVSRTSWTVKNSLRVITTTCWLSKMTYDLWKITFGLL